MKITFNDKITQADFPKAGEAFDPRFVKNYADMVRQVSQALQSNVNFADNMNASWITASCTHATAVGLANPLPNKSAPKQVVVYPGLQPIRSYTWSYAPSTNQINLTVNYDVVASFTSISRVSSNGLAITTGSPFNVCTTSSITLTPGDWDVRANVNFSPAATTNVTLFVSAVSQTSATFPAGDTAGVPTNGELRDYRFPFSAGYVPGGGFVFPVGMYRVPVAVGSTLPLFLVAQAAFTVSTMTVSGSLEARLVGPAQGTNDTPTILVIGG